MKGVFTKVELVFLTNLTLRLFKTFFLMCLIRKADLKIQESRPQALNIVFSTKIGF